MKKLFFFASALLVSTMMMAAEYSIVFKTNSSDSQTEIGSKTKVTDVVSSGDEYVSGFGTCSKAYYNSTSGIKLGSSKATGTFVINIASKYQTVTSIKVVSAQYGSDTGTLEVFNGSESLGSGITPGEDFEYDFAEATAVQSIKITTSAKRAYISEIILSTEVKKRIPVTDIKLDTASIEVKERETVTLVATIIPDSATNKKVTWISLDEKIATVKDGVVKGIAQGETKIIVASQDSAAIQDTCVVTVTEGEPIVAMTIAEVKAAYGKKEIKDNDEITVKGYISSISLKPSDFEEFGYVTIWLTDTEAGTAKEFELYHCYGMDGDTLASFTPTATGTKSVEVTSVTGRDGCTFKTGDLIEAFGKFKLYNTTYELNAGCYITKGGSQPTALENIIDNNVTTKFIENGQVIIIRNGVRYNVAGQQIQ